jgi:hypothetical protein
MNGKVRRAASRVADVIRQMDEGQRRMLVLRTAMDRYTTTPGRAPDTYAEFLARTSGVLLHEPPASKRLRKGRHLAL